MPQQLCCKNARGKVCAVLTLLGGRIIQVGGVTEAIFPLLGLFVLFARLFVCVCVCPLGLCFLYFGDPNGCALWHLWERALHGFQEMRL